LFKPLKKERQLAIARLPCHEKIDYADRFDFGEGMETQQNKSSSHRQPGIFTPCSGASEIWKNSSAPASPIRSASVTLNDGEDLKISFPARSLMIRQMLFLKSGESTMAKSALCVALSMTQTPSN